MTASYLSAIHVVCGTVPIPAIADCFGAGDRFPPLVDCTPRGEAFRRMTVGADYGDTRVTDEYGRLVEAQFQTMKALADEARWPADLASAIVEIDQSWQRAKGQSNAGKVAVARLAPKDGPLRKSMQEMIEKLEDRLGRGSSNAGWIAAGVAAAIAIGGAAFMALRGRSSS